jgi:hypothetical protein
MDGLGTIVDAALVASMVRLVSPILLAALGGLLTERAGIFNVALEGMMLIGAFFGAWGADITGSWFLGIVIALAAGAIFAAGAELADWYVADKQAAALNEAKRAMSEAYLAEAEKVAERWKELGSEARDDTTRRLLVETQAMEEDLFGRLVSTQEQLRTLRDVRELLDNMVDEAINRGYADATEGTAGT